MNESNSNESLEYCLHLNFYGSPGTPTSLKLVGMKNRKRLR